MTDYLIVDTIGLKFIPAMICSKAVVTSTVGRSVFEDGSSLYHEGAAVQALSLEVLSGTR